MKSNGAKQKETFNWWGFPIHQHSNNSFYGKWDGPKDLTNHE
jgi:hypothetical protein